MAEAGSIDEVIARLSEIVDRAEADGSRLGYFPALYRKVTARVDHEIRRGTFDDGERMTRLDVAFANRYLEAFELHRTGRPPTRSWDTAFRTTGRWWPIVLQHLLLGINAHINLDLGIAAAQTAPGAALPALRGDFDRINGILASMVGEVQQELAQVWTALRWFNRHLGDGQRVLINFSMERARAHAWSVAEQLAATPPADWPAAIERLDLEVDGLAALILRPGPVTAVVTKVVRIGERGTVGEIVRLLR